VPELNVPNMTDKRCKDLIDACHIDRNPMSGISGSYYTANREKDLKKLCVEILYDRIVKEE
jgi:hypothetical protein